MALVLVPESRPALQDAFGEGLVTENLPRLLSGQRPQATPSHPVIMLSDSGLLVLLLRGPGKLLCVCVLLLDTGRPSSSELSSARLVSSRIPWLRSSSCRALPVR